MPERENTKRIESDYDRATSRETRELLGIDPLRISVEYKPPSRLLSHVVEGVSETAIRYVDGVQVKKDTEANALFFPVEPGDQTWGLITHKAAFERGASGVMITSVPKPINHEDLLTISRVFLANVPSQYGLIAVGDPSSIHLEGMYILSMEGARPYVNFEETGEQSGFREVAERLTRLPGGRHNTSTRIEYSSSSLTQTDEEAIDEMIRAGKRLNELGLMPLVSLDDYASGRRGLAIRTFLRVSGLSEANFSMLQKDYALMTQSGRNKGELKRKGGTARIKGLNPDLSGVTVSLSKEEEFKKISVESVDNYMLYAVRAGVKSGHLKDADLQAFLDYLSDGETVSQDLQQLSEQESPSLIHLHTWVEEGSYDPEIFSLTDVSSRLVPNKAMHSSCGTHPLAKYSAVAGLEAELNEKQRGTDRVKILLMPNHGIQMDSPHPLNETIDIVEEAINNGSFQPSPVPPR